MYMQGSDKLTVVRSWFRKAENDLVNAEHTMTMAYPPCDTVCFHAQQCAEKYLKGFLTYHQIPFPKTHSLESLVVLCTQAAQTIEDELDDIEKLSGYGVEVRYPDEVYYDIPRADAIEAVELAKLVKTVVLRHLEGLF